MKIVYFTIMSLLAHLVTHAQTNKFSVTLNPLSFLERDGGFTPGIGYSISKRISFFSDLGVIFFSPGNTKGGVVETNKSIGYKVKPAIRYYTRRNEMQKGPFLEVEGLYKNVVYDAIDEIDVIDNNGNFAYTYIGGYKIKKEVFGFSFKYGSRFFLYKEKKLGMDIFIGIGSRSKDFTVSGLPTGAQMDNDPFSEDRPFNFFWRRGKTVSFPFGAKIFYNF